MATNVKSDGVFRSLGLFVLHTLLAIFGPAIVGTSLHGFIVARSGSQVVLRTWIISIVCACLIAFFMTRVLPSRAALWVWVLPGLWLGFGILARAGSNDAGLLGETVVAHFSGTTCAATLDLRVCRDFFVFAVPFVRTLAYSAGSLLLFVLQRFTNPEPAAIAGTEGTGA